MCHIFSGWIHLCSIKKYQTTKQSVLNKINETNCWLCQSAIITTSSAQRSNLSTQSNSAQATSICQHTSNIQSYKCWHHPSSTSKVESLKTLAFINCPHKPITLLNNSQILSNPNSAITLLTIQICSTHLGMHTSTASPLSVSSIRLETLCNIQSLAMATYPHSILTNYAF